MNKDSLKGFNNEGLNSPVELIKEKTKKFGAAAVAAVAFAGAGFGLSLASSGAHEEDMGPRDTMEAVFSSGSTWDTIEIKDPETGASREATLKDVHQAVQEVPGDERVDLYPQSDHVQERAAKAGMSIEQVVANTVSKQAYDRYSTSKEIALGTCAIAFTHELDVEYKNATWVPYPEVGNFFYYGYDAAERGTRKFEKGKEDVSEQEVDEGWKDLNNRCNDRLKESVKQNPEVPVVIPRSSHM